MLFPDDVALLVSSNQNLQDVLGQFAAVCCCATAGMKISTSKTKAMVSRPEKGSLPSLG